MVRDDFKSDKVRNKKMFDLLNRYYRMVRDDFKSDKVRNKKMFDLLPYGPRRL